MEYTYYDTLSMCFVTKMRQICSTKTIERDIRCERSELKVRLGHGSLREIDENFGGSTGELK